MDIFTPKSDDALILAREVPTEYALVKSSGYLGSYGFGGFALAQATAYSLTHGGRVIVSRVVGDSYWTIVEQAFTAPDDLSGLDTESGDAPE